MSKDKENKAPGRVVAALRKKFGDDAAMLMGEAGTGVREVCPTGMAVLDRWVLGVGGLPYGRIFEVFGAESAGKSTIMNKILAGAQRDGGVAILCETEHSYDPAWAKLHGVQIDDLVLLQPNYLDGEMGALAQFEAAIGRHKKVVIALDSVAATQTKIEYEEGITGGAAMAELARAWSRGMRILAPVIARAQAILVLVNQTRAVIGKMYGPTETTPGGNAIKFHASVRLSVYHGKRADGGTARFLGVQAMKNKVAPPFRKAQFKLDFASGFDEPWSILDHAKEMGCVEAKCHDVDEAVEALHWKIEEAG